MQLLHAAALVGALGLLTLASPSLAASDVLLPSESGGQGTLGLVPQEDNAEASSGQLKQTPAPFDPNSLPSTPIPPPAAPEMPLVAMPPQAAGIIPPNAYRDTNRPMPTLPAGIIPPNAYRQSGQGPSTMPTLPSGVIPPNSFRGTGATSAPQPGQSASPGTSQGVPTDHMPVHPDTGKAASMNDIQDLAKNQTAAQLGTPHIIQRDTLIPTLANTNGASTPNTLTVKFAPVWSAPAQRAVGLELGLSPDDVASMCTEVATGRINADQSGWASFDTSQASGGQVKYGGSIKQLMLTVIALCDLPQPPQHGIAVFQVGKKYTVPVAMQSCAVPPNLSTSATMNVVIGPSGIPDCQF